MLFFLISFLNFKHSDLMAINKKMKLKHYKYIVRFFDVFLYKIIFAGKGNSILFKENHLQASFKERKEKNMAMGLED